MRLSVADVTADQPFCAGLLLVRGGRHVVALNTDHLPPDDGGPDGGPVWRVSAIGGGQEVGETVWECALREAHEEAGATVDLVPAPVTFLHDWETHELRPVDCADADPPLLLERYPRNEPDIGLQPGLPAGPYLYVAIFLAVAGAAAQLRPGDDVAGLLLVPDDALALLERDPTLAEAVDAGAELVEREPLPRDGRLWMHPNESLRIARPLLDEPAVRAALGGS